jgi:hypothetical protein
MFRGVLVQLNYDFAVASGDRHMKIAGCNPDLSWLQGKTAFRFADQDFGMCRQSFS